MASRILFSALILSLASIPIACAHGGSSPEASANVSDKSDYIEPKVLSSNSQMRLRTRSSRPFRGTVEVPVTEHGRAEVFSMRIIGTMDELMKKDLQEWLQQVTFAPARRDGVPVAGVYTMRFR